MQPIERVCIRRLIEDPTSYAMMLDQEELEQVIAVFVSVLNQRTKNRGD
jgi:hypothetical protein